MRSCKEQLLDEVEIVEDESQLTESDRKVSDFDQIKKDEKFGVQTLESYQAYVELAG
jgi:hypothetical protein